MRSKAEKLALAAAIAPAQRTIAERKDKGGRVTIVDKDGNVVGYSTRADVMRQLGERAGVELTVVASKRPTHMLCPTCGKMRKVRKTGPAKPLCGPCSAARRRARARKYDATEKGRAYRRAYRTSEKGRAYEKERAHERSEKRRAARQRRAYRTSEKERERSRKYDLSEKGRAYRRAYRERQKAKKEKRS